MRHSWYYNSFEDKRSSMEFMTQKFTPKDLSGRKPRLCESEKRPRNAYSRVVKDVPHSSTQTTAKQSETLTAMMEKFAPEEEDELAVHPKKIAELKSWMTNQMAVQHGLKTLLLTGPTGCGKTTAVKVLCAELGIEVIEFDGNIEYHLSFTGEIYEKSMVRAFTQFMGSSEFSSIGRMSLKHRLVLIRQLPNMFYREPDIFRQAMRDCARSSRCMIAFVMTSNESSWELNPSRLFTPSLMEELQIHHVKFNAISVTQMAKTVKNIAGVLGIKLEKAGAAKQIATCANGDIRRAINSMDFFGGVQRQAKGSLSASDGHFELFHFIGKVMYAKRASTSTEAWTAGESKLKARARSKARPLPPKEDLNELASTGFISGKFLASYVFEHEPAFAPSVSALRSIVSNFCDLDACFSTELDSHDVIDRYLFEIITRSAIYHNYDAKPTSQMGSRRGLYQFVKPKYKEICEQRDIAIQQQRQDKVEAKILSFDNNIAPFQIRTSRKRAGG